MLFRSRAVTVCLLASLSLHASQISADRDRMVRVITQLRASNPQLAAQIEDICRSKEPVFVFGPGDLGSRLFDAKGNVIWGERASGAGVTHGLMFQWSTKHVELLASFKIFGYEQDAYGRMMAAVQELDVLTVDHWIQFPHDWRADRRRPPIRPKRFFGAPRIKRGSRITRWSSSRIPWEGWLCTRR